MVPGEEDQVSEKFVEVQVTVLVNVSAPSARLDIERGVDTVMTLLARQSQVRVLALIATVRQ
jgi:hypothetical protein